MTTDAARMRRVRRAYVARCAAWLEADRDRIYELRERMQALGIYAATSCECDVRCSILTYLAKADGYDTYRLRNQWLLKTGWAAYYGWSNSPRRRLKNSQREIA